MRFAAVADRLTVRATERSPRASRSPGPGSEFTRDFERLVAWLVSRTDKGTIKRLLRIDWGTVGRIVKRVCDEELDPDRLNKLFEIGMDEVS